MEQVRYQSYWLFPDTNAVKNPKCLTHKHAQAYHISSNKSPIVYFFPSILVL